MKRKIKNRNQADLVFFWVFIAVTEVAVPSVSLRISCSKSKCGCVILQFRGLALPDWIPFSVSLLSVM